MTAAPNRRGGAGTPALAKIEIKYVQAFADRHGRRRHYFRRRGFATVALPGEPGSDEFMDAYAQALASAGLAVPAPGAARVQPRSINALIIEYYRSAEFRDLRASTQRAYRGQLDRFRTDHGDKTAANLRAHHLEAIFHAMSDRPEAAANLRKRLRRVFSLAVRLGWRQDNPVRETERPGGRGKGRKRGIAPWSEADITAFQAHWAEGTRERLALALLLYTGQRRSDVVVMGSQHVSGGRISVAQLKTDARLKIRLHPQLRDEIARHPVTMTYLQTGQGQGFTVEGFGNWFRDACRDAGLTGRSPHGLRKAAGRRLAEAGCTEKQIAAILGHESLSEVARYTRDANRVLLADEAMDRLEAAETRTPMVKPV